MSTSVPTVSRRRVLIGTAALVLLGSTVSACGEPPPPPDLDELEAQRALATHDSELAVAASIAAPAEIVPALDAVAAERRAHADALTEEIARAAGHTATTTGETPSESSDPSATTSASTAPEPPPTVADVVDALRNSARSSAELAASVSGYRAGLLGSISAACTAAALVGLVAPEPAS